jgi:hypothetical protein
MTSQNKWLAEVTFSCGQHGVHFVMAPTAIDTSEAPRPLKVINYHKSALESRLMIASGTTTNAGETAGAFHLPLVHQLVSTSLFLSMTSSLNRTVAIGQNQLMT